MRKYLNDYFVERPNTPCHTSIFKEICNLDTSNTFPNNICYIPTKLESITNLLILTSIDFHLKFYSKYNVRQRFIYLLSLAMENTRFLFLGIIIITTKLVNAYKNTFKMIKCHKVVDDNMLKIIMKLLS